MRRLSSRVIPPTGTAIIADPPPDKSTTSVSPGASDAASFSAPRPARSLSASGTGWLPGITSNVPGSSAGAVPTTRPARIRDPHNRTTVDASGAAALPAHRTRIPPSGSAPGRVRARSSNRTTPAPAMPLRTMASRSWRSFESVAFSGFVSDRTRRKGLSQRRTASRGNSRARRHSLSNRAARAVP